MKAGVALDGIRGELLTGLWLAEQVFDAHGYDCVVTSIADGMHKPDSFHYKGLAADLRTHHILSSERDAVITLLAAVLTPLGFDVLHEAVGEPNEHVHLEYDPKGAP